MRWSYKTVLYELKKEGLLGSAFLDESEIEQSLNEFGTTGWELISMLETRDGIIAVFKQPLGRLSGKAVCEEQEADEIEDDQVISTALQSQFLREGEPVVRKSEPMIRAKEQAKEKTEPVSEIGSIRIE